jgi:protein-tyrosine phosphatase
MTRVLFVCLGNICRSPTAGRGARLRRTGGERLELELIPRGPTATTRAPPDERSIATARRRGIDMSDLRARVGARGFRSFDLVLAMDEAVYGQLSA